jgi:hypothetical protein
MDLTGSSEAQARSVFMYVCSQNGQTPDSAREADLVSPQIPKPAPQSSRPERVSPGKSWLAPAATSLAPA